MENKELELLNELEKVEELIEKVKITRDIVVKSHEIQQLMVIYGLLLQVYPSVKFTNPNGGCGSCVWDFLQQVIPIYDRLSTVTVNDKVEVEEVVEVPQVKEVVVEVPKPKGGGRKKK